MLSRSVCPAPLVSKCCITFTCLWLLHYIALLISFNKHKHLNKTGTQENIINCIQTVSMTRIKPSSAVLCQMLWCWFWILDTCVCVCVLYRKNVFVTFLSFNLKNVLTDHRAHLRMTDGTEDPKCEDGSQWLVAGWVINSSISMLANGWNLRAPHTVCEHMILTSAVHLKKLVKLWR